MKTQLTGDATIDRSRIRSIGRIEKHIHELIAAIGVWGPTSGMTDAELAEVPKAMSDLIATLWLRKKADEDAQRSNDARPEPKLPWEIEA